MREKSVKTKLIAPLFILPIIAAFLGQHPTTAKLPIIERRIAKTENHFVSGHGAPRAHYGECQNDITVFEKTLERQGITPLEPVQCLPYATTGESFAPHFRGTSIRSENYVTFEGAPFNGLSFCHLHRLKMVEETDNKNRVLESSCLKIANNVYANAPNEMFIPVLILKNFTPAQALQAAAE